MRVRHRNAMLRLGAVALSILGIGVSSAEAVTRIMPNRLALTNTAVVLWGNTTQPNTTGATLDCGVGAPLAILPASMDQSYISRQCTYTAEGSFTATLTVGAETATVTITVIDPANPGLTAAQLRDARINMAIEDGLRFLYFSQVSRAARYNTNMTSWNGNFAGQDPHVYTAMALLALQNHHHSVTADPNVDIYQTVVQRGLNFLFDLLQQQPLTCTTEPAAADVCVNVPAPVATGLRSLGNTGYSTPIIGAAIGAASAVAPNRVVDAGLGSQNSQFVAGKTYAEITQRIANTVVWGQSDSEPGRGGWYYSLEAGTLSDGSTVGWGLLGLIDMGGGGATILQGARDEVARLVTDDPAVTTDGNQLNTNGSFDYQADTSLNSVPAMTRVGIGLQALAFSGVPLADPRVTAVVNYITTNWNTNVNGGDTCTAGSPTTHNKGCGYSMFNIFKGLRLYGISTLNIGDPDGAGPLGAGDWYGDYVNNLLTNQHLPTDPTRGEWNQAANPTMGFSCCSSDTTGISSMALLILAPTAFVPPDPILFSTVGLTPFTDTNPPGTQHTVIATAQAAGGSPIPGATINFTVLTGPNAGKTGSGVSNAQGQVSFTYTDTSVPPYPQTDTIRASIGTLNSNTVTKTWAIAATKCDVDANNVVNQLDLNAIRNANGQPASGPTDARDGNGDGFINVADLRFCQLRLGPVPQ